MALLGERRRCRSSWDAEGYKTSQHTQRASNPFLPRAGLIRRLKISAAMRPSSAIRTQKHSIASFLHAVFGEIISPVTGSIAFGPLRRLGCAAGACSAELLREPVDFRS